MRIRSIKCYQAVNYANKVETSFTVIPIAGKTPIKELVFNKELMSVEVISNIDHVLVPLTNISAIHLWTEKDDRYMEGQDVLKKPHKAQEIKKPR